MAISQAKKNEIIAKYARHEGDTGSAEVQIAVLTADINESTNTSVFTGKTSIHNVD